MPSAPPRRVSYARFRKTPDKNCRALAQKSTCQKIAERSAKAHDPENAKIAGRSARALTRKSACRRQLLIGPKHAKQLLKLLIGPKHARQLLIGPRISAGPCFSEAARLRRILN